MKQLVRKIFIVIELLGITASLSSCGAPESPHDDPVNIAFVLGIADDETRFDDSIRELSSIPALPGTDYVFISAEGEPTVIGEPGTIKDFSDRGYNSMMMERVSAGIKADLKSRVDSFEPLSSEIDLARSIEIAGNALRSKMVDGRQNILCLYCSGKSTKGLINFLNTPIYRLDVEASAESVAQQMHVDMSNINVVWYCLGCFGDEQDDLSSNEKTKLESFYRMLFEKLGAMSVEFKKDLPRSDCYHFDDTPVSCMQVEGIQDGLKSDDLVTGLVLPESQVRFKPDSADFVDPEAAKAAIKPIADFMLANSELSVLVYGTVAGDKPDELGYTRAETVKEVLIGYGVNESCITSITVDPKNDPYYVFGLGTTDECCSVNRKVVLLDLNSELASQILAHAI